MEADRESEVQSHPLLHSEFEVSLGYIRPCRKERREGEREGGKEGRRELRINKKWHKPGTPENNLSGQI